ncbi:PH domain-containing protein [Arthrobacter sp. PAMC25284]|uniref:PH domain-containing protein n=1 Tax=Arthrobacter sp. PAMC25284 TaxID=2861279 RepID=UPI001C639FB7|nr:PH domain-containing protein [Arthrobacter sp. PAMC25284]QYF90852.1 PH domain-containing protein [Arthrobacter sp. PAMC25284]
MRKDLLPGEQVIVVTRPQPRTLMVPALVVIVLAAAGAYASAWIHTGGPAKLVPFITREWDVWLLAGCAALVVWVILGYCLPRFLAWHGTHYTLTSQRLVARYGMLRRRDQQVSLAAVHDVEVEQTLLQRVFRSGNISLDTGYPLRAVVPDIPEIGTFRNFLQDAINDLPRGGTAGADAMLRMPQPGQTARDERRWMR